MKTIMLCLVATTILFVNEVSAKNVFDIQEAAKKNEEKYEVNLPPKEYVDKFQSQSQQSNKKHRRSAESSEEEEEKSPFSSIGKAFDYVKDSVKGAYHNVTNSDAAAKVSEQFDKFKEGVKETGKKVKAAVHDYTAPSEDHVEVPALELPSDKKT